MAQHKVENRNDSLPQTTSILQNGDLPVFGTDMDADERGIISLGYKQEFKREFSLWSTFGVSFSVLGLLPSFASTLYYGTFRQLVNKSTTSFGVLIWIVSQAWDMLGQQE